MQDISLTYDFTKKLNAANIHRGMALLAAYHNAIDLFDRKEARQDYIKRVEQEMRSFK